MSKEQLLKVVRPTRIAGKKSRTFRGVLSNGLAASVSLTALMAATPVFGDTIPTWSTNCGTWTATDVNDPSKTVTGSSITIPNNFGNKYDINLNCAGATGA